MERIYPFVAVCTVTDKNIITVYDTSPHLMPSPRQLMGLKSAVMHLKNNTISIPRINRANNEVSKDGRTCEWESLARAIEDRADEDSGEAELFKTVQIVCDIWSIRIVGPQLILRVGHGSCLHERGMILAEGGLKVGKRNSEIKRRLLGWERRDLGL